MRVQRGDVVLVDYPFSDRTGSKVRPCLVIQNDHNNARLDDTIVAMITSRQRYAAQEPTQLLIEVSTPDGAATGLLFDSAVTCENLLTIDRSFLRRKMGTFSPTLMRQVDACLKASLGIV